VSSRPSTCRLAGRGVDAVLDDVRGRQGRPLDAVYPALRRAAGQDPERCDPTSVDQGRGLRSAVPVANPEIVGDRQGCSIATGP
jgi:hypothetical protein